MTTAREIITRAAQELGVVRKGEALSADEVSDGLDWLNELMASWASEALINVGRYRESFTLGTGAEFTIGTGQTLDTALPTKILEAFIRRGDIDYTLNIINDYEYRAETFKTIQASPAWNLNYSKDPNAATGVIRLYPASSGGDELHILSEKPFTELTSANNTVFMPSAGFKRALRTNLALDMAASYDIDPKPSLVDAARKSLGAIKREAARAHKIRYRPSSGGLRNINTGYNV